MTLLAKASIQYGCTNQSNQNQAYDCRNSFVGTKYNDKINRSDFLKMKAQEYYLSLIIWGLAIATNKGLS